MLPKAALHAACLAYVQQRLAAARAAMQAAQASANQETKSSAGDKYETGRAMAQLERDQHAAQLHEAQKLEVELARLNPDLACNAARPGTVVETDRGLFYLSIGAGKLVADGQEFFAVSPAAPVAAALAGKRAGEEAQMNGQVFRVLRVG